MANTPSLKASIRAVSLVSDIKSFTKKRKIAYCKAQVSSLRTAKTNILKTEKYKKYLNQNHTYIRVNGLAAMQKWTTSAPSSSLTIQVGYSPYLYANYISGYTQLSKTPPDTIDFAIYLAIGVMGLREMWTHIDAMPRVNLWRK